jgi:hypothetical protein
MMVERGTQARRIEIDRGRELGLRIPRMQQESGWGSLFPKAETTTKELVEVPELERTTTREQRKSAQGCAMRALASAVKATPREAEWQMRFQQIDADSPFQLALKNPRLNDGQRESITQAAKEHADREVVGLISQFTNHDSELGEALRNVQIEPHGKLDETGIRELIASGRDVCILGRVEGGGRHMVHVTQNQKGELIAQSDCKQVIDLSSGEYNTIAFAKPGQEPVALTIRPERGLTNDETMKYGPLPEREARKEANRLRRQGITN